MKYSLEEIDRLRVLAQDGMQSSYQMGQREVVIEERVRTYMTAGLTVAQLEEQMRERRERQRAAEEAQEAKMLLLYCQYDGESVMAIYERKWAGHHARECDRFREAYGLLPGAVPPPRHKRQGFFASILSDRKGQE